MQRHDSILIDHILTSLKPKAPGDAALDAARTLLRAAQCRSILQACDIGELYSKSLALVANASRGSQNHKIAGCVALTAFAAYGPLQLFLESFMEWGTHGLDILKSTTSLSSLNAAWQLVTSIFQRMSVNSFSYAVEGAGTRREVFQLASKVCSALVSALSDGASLTLPVMHSALTALTAVLEATPAAVKSYYQALEHSLLQIVFSDEQLSHSSECVPLAMDCMTSLPQCFADKEAWSKLAYRLLATTHSFLDEMQIPTASGVDGSIAGTAFDVPRSHVSRKVVLLFDCLSRLLVPKIPPAYAVSVPVEGIFGVIERTLSSATLSFPSSVSRGRLVTLYLDLPPLHIAAFKLLRTTVQAVSTSYTPWLMTVTRFLDGYLRTAMDAASSTNNCQEREASYLTCRALMHSGGLSVARLLAPTLINECSKLEFYPHINAKDLTWATREIDEQRLIDRTTIKVQIEYLGALEMLLTVGGEGLGSKRVRAEEIIAHISTLLESRPRIKDDVGLERLQLAAYRALLASVLSPLDCRSPHLGLALSLFKQGCRRSSNSEFSEFCTHALLCCEALMHPRSFSMGSSTSRSESDRARDTVSIPKLWVWSDSLALEALEVLKESKKVGGAKRTGDELELILEESKEPDRARPRVASTNDDDGVVIKEIGAPDIMPSSEPVAVVIEEGYETGKKVSPKLEKEHAIGFRSIKEKEELLVHDDTTGKQPKGSQMIGSLRFTTLMDEGGAGDSSDDSSLPEIDSGVSSVSQDSDDDS